eukprot:TRINITY_DN12150_c0_g1_i1.p1 TRINITY_DN12150_c0_g1~~TRINITY_DN12150_c0_g1_i1.p1  ORF type:complete len:261 (+),score=50.51 TRINITY_DN12150_c0_g1_i1:47-829(+)
MVAEGTHNTGFPQKIEITLPVKKTEEGQSIFYPPPSAPPPPTAPLPPAANLSGCTEKAFPSNIEETLEWARLAVQADHVEKDVEKAIKLYDGAVIGFLNFEASVTNPQTRYQYRPYVSNYSERSEAMKMNLKNMRARQRAATMEAERQERRAANTAASSSSCSNQPTHRQYGWDGTLFSGKRRGQYDSAVSAFENAKLAEARGETEKARDLFTNSASLFYEFQKTEPDKNIATQICNKVNEIITKAEELDAKVKLAKATK